MHCVNSCKTRLLVYGIMLKAATDCNNHRLINCGSHSNSVMSQDFYVKTKYRGR